ncbi:MAG: glycosyltransferase [Ignavibacteria bacterium]|nr:glycosyltransferase [Ignavibacteria bacterium]
MIDISVIIVNYNVKELLEQCVKSVLEASDGFNLEIIIVDNNSYDGSFSYLSDIFKDDKRIKLIPSKVNLGFSKANNLAAKQASGEYLLFLNPDTVIREDTLTKTIEFYRSHDNVGGLTCKVILPNGKLDLACRRSFPTPSIAFYRIIGLSKIFPRSKVFGRYNLTYLDENQTYEVDSIVGAFMLIKKSVFDEVKGFDEDYFMYGEDIDLCFRIKKAGYKIYYYPETSIIHYKGESTKKSSLTYVSNFYGAMQIFARKNLNTRFVILDLIIRLSIFYRSFLSYLRRFFMYFYPAMIDIFMIVGGMLLAIHQRFEYFPLKAYSVVIVVYTIVWIISLASSGCYKPDLKYSLSRPLMGILIGFFINSSLTYFFQEYAFSRVVVLRTTFNAFIFLSVWRILAKIVEYKNKKSIFNSQKTIVIGRNDSTEKFIDKVKKRLDTEFDILGYISPDGTSEGFLGNLNNVEDIIKANGVKHVLFAKGELSNSKIIDLMWQLRNYDLSFKILSDDVDFILGKSPLDKVDEIYLIQIEYNINRKINIFTKRLFDILLGLILLLTVYPVFMVLNLVPSLRESMLIRKIKLFPRVIKGELSFVGRPVWEEDNNENQHLGKKGLTGLVQINSDKNLSREEIDYYNYYYAKNQTLLLDIEIILRTLSMLLFKQIKK